MNWAYLKWLHCCIPEVIACREASLTFDKAEPIETASLQSKSVIVSITKDLTVTTKQMVKYELIMAADLIDCYVF